MRIGFFICHCGSNIAGTVDVVQVAEYVSKLPNVVHSVHLMYTCSQPGQKEIVDAIKEKRLTRIVIAACSPKMHEVTFRRAIERTGLNPYLFEMANIREHCSWIHDDRELATQKAIELVEMTIAKVARHESLFSNKVDVNKKVLIIGGGIAGIQAALDMADGGFEVVLVEREPTIGGKMAQLDNTFPTIDCSSCILTPKMVDAGQHEKIKLITYAEIESVSGYVGNFEVKVHKKPPYVNYEKCIGCGICERKCPAKAPNRFNLGIGEGKAIYIPFPQAVPKVATITKEHCIYFKSLAEGKLNRCKICQKVCHVSAVDFEIKDEYINEKVGAIITAVGFDLFNHSVYQEYGGGRYPDVISSLQYERLLSASGPTEGKIKRPSDGKEPETVVFISCVGSRDDSVGRPYCSGICCMYMAKQAILTKDHLPESKTFIFYIDIRAGSKAYEEFVKRAQVEAGAQYIRGRVAKIYPENGGLIVRGVDTLLGQQVEVMADLVVLANGVISSRGSNELAQKLRIPYDQYGFLSEGHPKLKPVETNTAGIFLAGACQGPKDIPSSVAQGSATAGKVQGLLSKDQLETSPLVALVECSRCIGCFKCLKVCPYNAIERITLKDGSLVASVIPTVCQGCGLCVATCPSASITLKGFTDDQLIAEVEALCR
ncbi:MAG: CoB--CoM heterodisulfide reductase iron-sulfur subunit A family protein [Actinobacteria bacterium]|nr:CoB--CoM heterodisulfide reductase iron-sulfur subunit A family protein [Actinomycetota bacterium]